MRFRQVLLYPIVIPGLLLAAGCAGEELTGPDLNPFDPLSTNFSDIELIDEFQIELGEMVPVQIEISDSGHFYVLWQGDNSSAIVKYDADGDELLRRLFTNAQQRPTDIDWWSSSLRVTFNAHGYSNNPVTVQAFTSMLMPGVSVLISPLLSGEVSAEPLRVELTDGGEIHVSYRASGTTATADSLNRVVNVFDSTGVYQRHFDIDTSGITETYTSIMMPGIAIASNGTLYA